MIRWMMAIGWVALFLAANRASRAEGLGNLSSQQPCRSSGKSVSRAATVLVPRITYANRSESVLTLQPRVQQKTVTVLRDVPETRTVKRLVPVLVPEEQTVTETYAECRLVEEEVSREVVVWQPQAELQEGTRTTSHPVLIEEKRTILKDVGGWVLRERVDCCGRPRVCRVWQPKLVTEEIGLTLLNLETVETPFREEVVTYRPETKTVTERICRPVLEEKTREVTQTVCVEKLVEREFTELTWHGEAEEQTVNYLAPEVVTEQRELPFATRQLVPRVVECPPMQAGKSACR